MNKLWKESIKLHIKEQNIEKSPIRGLIYYAYEFGQAYSSCTKKTNEYSKICTKYAPEHNGNKSFSNG